MTDTRTHERRAIDGVGKLIAMVALAAAAFATHPSAAQDAPTLRQKAASLREQLVNNQFGRPIVLETQQDKGDLQGDVYAVVDQSYPVVADALKSLPHWCDILLLHLNVKGCTINGVDRTLTLAVGRKFDQPTKDAYLLRFDYRVAAATTDYLQVTLHGAEGPYGTSDYRITVEATPVDGSRSIIHMSYAYTSSLAARMAMGAYLATVGRSKVGFTVVGKSSDGTPRYIGGIPGLLERNTMRYYLAIESYLMSASAPPAERAERRIRAWYEGTERYAPQLHEMDRDEYLEMKRKEIVRPRTPS